MKKITLLFAALLASTSALAAEPQKFEFTVVQIDSQSGQTGLESLKLSAVDGKTTLATTLDQHTYIRACTATTVEKANFETGLSASIKPVSVDSSGNILADVDLKYSRLMSMGKFKSNGCEVQLPSLKEFRVNAMYQVGAKNPVMLGEIRVPGSLGLRYEIWLFAKI